MGTDDLETQEADARRSAPLQVAEKTSNPEVRSQKSEVCATELGANLQTSTFGLQTFHRRLGFSAACWQHLDARLASLR
jgi:hypothetical protein